MSKLLKESVPKTTELHGPVWQKLVLKKPVLKGTVLNPDTRTRGLPALPQMRHVLSNVPWFGLMFGLGAAAVVAPKIRSAQPFIVPVGQALVPAAGIAIAGLSALGAVVTRNPAYMASCAAGLWASSRPWRVALAQQRRTSHQHHRAPHRHKAHHHQGAQAAHDRAPARTAAPSVGAHLLSPAPKNPQPAAANYTFTLVSINVLYGRADASQLARFAAQLDADFVLVQECTEEFCDGLEKARTPHRFCDIYPHRFGTAAHRAAGTVTYSKLPGVHTTDWLIDTAGADDRHNPVVRFDTPAGEMTISNVHTVPPAPHWATAWGRQLRRIRYHARHTCGPLIVAGDFNADLCHPAFHDLLSTFQDGVNGSASRPWSWLRTNTWPQGSRLEFVRLDHILGRGLNLCDGGTISVAGTDHRGTWAQWTLAQDTHRELTPKRGQLN